MGYSCALRAKYVLGNAYLRSLTKTSGTNSVSNLILEVEVRCHKVQIMTEAFIDSIIPGNLSAVSLEKSGECGFLVN